MCVFPVHILHFASKFESHFTQNKALGSQNVLPFVHFNFISRSGRTLTLIT